MERPLGRTAQAPPWLVCCGPCGALGTYPLQVKAVCGVVPAGMVRNRLGADMARREGRLVKADGAWAWVRCAECGGTGRVSKFKAAKKLPQHVRKTADAVRHAHGWEGWPPSHPAPKLYTRWWYLREGVRDVARSFR